MNLKFQCLYCPHCCVFQDKQEMPLVFYWEKETLEKLASELGVKIDVEPYLIVNDGAGDMVYMYRWIINGKCPFLDENNRCRIHKEKPIACKMFPFILEIPSLRVYLSEKCDWVKKYLADLDPQKLGEVFPEFEIVAKVAGMLNEFFAIAKENGWKIILADGSRAMHN